MTMRTNRRFSLRVTIASLVVGLLFATVAGVLAIALIIRGQTITATAEIIQGEISTRITEKIQERFGPLGDLLREYQASSTRGLLPLDDQELLVRQLVERVQYDSRIEWLAFLGSDGSAAGSVRMPDGKIRAIRKEPGESGDVIIETWSRDGAHEPSKNDALDLSTIQQVAWFQLGSESIEPVWTPPYVRPMDGTLGRACALAIRSGDELVGVFGLGFGVEFLREYIQGLEIGESGCVFTLHPEHGEILVSPSDEDLERLGPIVREAIDRLPGGLTGLTPADLQSTPVSYGGVSYRVGLERKHLSGLPPLVYALVVPEDELVGFLKGYLPFGIAAVAALLCISAVLAQVLARRVASPLREIASDLERIGDFKLSKRPAPASLIREVAVVSESTERMKASLRSFGRYVPTDLVRDLLAQGAEAHLGGEERPLTLFFSDVEGFTGLSEGMKPKALVEALGSYLEVVTKAVKDQGGTIDKFIGDGVLAFFNAPRDDPNHVASGCRAALELQKHQWETLGRPPFRTRVGLHTDEVVVGNIGTPERFSYTVIGDGVNLAARLESLNKAYGTWILCSDGIFERAGQEFAWRRVDRTAVVGRATGSDVFELLGSAGSVDTPILEARDCYEQALEYYFKLEFEKAAKGFAEAARMRPGDRAAEVLQQRAISYAATPPLDGWNGVYVQTKK
jgi:adenylate cyclase